jgi:hypothetical protein
MKKSFLVYLDSYEMLQYLNDEQLGKVLRMMFEFAINGICIEPSDPLFFVFKPIESQIKRDMIRYEEIKEKRANAGKEGGRGKKKNKTKKANALNEKQNKQEKTKESDIDRDTDIVIETDTEKETVIEKEKATAKPKEISFKKWTKEVFGTKLREYMQENPDKYSKELLNSFYRYWSEDAGDGKIRLNKQEAFEISRRLITFDKNDKNKTPQPEKTFSRSSKGIHL